MKRAYDNSETRHSRFEPRIGNPPKANSFRAGDDVRRFGAVLGDVGAARWVAQTVRSRELAADCPIHRVALKSGELSGGNVPDQQLLLEKEGVVVANQKVDLAGVGFREFESKEPLAVLKASQNKVPTQLELASYEETPGEIAAVDLSYLDDDWAVACYALVETATGKLLWSETVHRPVPFPYISGYLAYRELPILLDLLEHVQSRAR